MSRLKNICLIGLTFVMTACVGFHDQRPPAEQLAALLSARDKLVGDYQVLEARNDKYSGFDHVSVRSQGDLLVVTLDGPKRTWTIHVMGCRGYDAVQRGFLDLMCDTGDVNYISIGQHRYDRTTEAGAKLASIDPMTTSGDEYMLEIGMHGGRSYYYRLKK